MPQACSMDACYFSCDPNPVLHQHEHLFNAGVNSGAIFLQEDGVIMRINSGWRLMAASVMTNTSIHSIIFWKPKNVLDFMPTLEKVMHICLSLCVLTNYVIKLKLVTMVHNI